MLVQVHFVLIQFGLFVVYVNSNLVEMYDKQVNSDDTNVEVPSKLVNYLSNLIAFYKDFDIHFHFDGTSSYLSNNLIKVLNFEFVSSIILSNYDFGHTRLERSNTKHILHVVMLEFPNDFIFYSRNIENARSTDVVHFVVQDDCIRDIKPIKEIPGLNLFGNVLIVIGDKIPHIYKICYFCGNLNGEVKELKNLFEENNLKPASFNNFNGHTFRITFIDYFPLVWCAEVGKDFVIHRKAFKLCTKVKGTEYKLISALAKTLNFKIIPIVRYDDYVEAINETGRGLFDVAMGGITVTAPRCKLATFTTMYWYEGYNCLFFLKNSESWSGVFSFLQPLQGVLWIAFICACIVVVISLYIIGKCKRYKDSNLPGLKILWIAMYFLVDQQAPLKSLSKLQKRSFFLLCAWCLVCLNMSTAYKSKLLSTLLNPSHSEPQNMMELLEKGYQIVTNTNYADVVTAFLSVGWTNNKYRDVLKNPVLIDTVCDEFDYAATHRGAVIDEYTSLQYEVRNTCHERLKKYKHQLEHVRISKPLRMFGHGWALRKRAPFEDAFNRIIYRIIRAGLILKWRQDVTRGMDNNKTVFQQSQAHVKERKAHGRVRLRTLISPFFVYIMGNVFALVAFIGEIILYKMK